MQRPDFIFSTVVGDDIAKLHLALARAGVDPYEIPVASHMSTEVEIAAMGADLAEGLLTCASYFQSLPGAANERAMRLQQQRADQPVITNMCWEAAYLQMHMLAAAMRRAETAQPTRVARALPGLELEAPQGRVRVDPHNHHTDLNPRIGRCNGRGQFDILAAAPAPVAADPYVVSHLAPEWALLAAARATAEVR